MQVPTHFLPGSSEGGRAWPEASLSGSCPPDTPSFSGRVEENNVTSGQLIPTIASAGHEFRMQ